MLMTCSRCDQWSSPTEIKKSESDILQTVLSLLQQHIRNQDVKMKSLEEELSAIKKMLSQCDVSTSSSKTIEPMDTLNSTIPTTGNSWWKGFQAQHINWITLLKNDHDLDGVNMTVPSSTSTPSTSTTTVTPSTTQVPRTMGSRGSEFLILFMKNHPAAHGNLTIYITTNNETTVKILISPHLNANIKLVNSFTSSFTLTLPRDIVCEYLTVEPKGLILQTSELSTVTIFDSFYEYSNDGTLIIPTKKLSNRYIISSTEPYITSGDYFSQFAIGALYNRTDVEIKFKMKQNTTLTIQGKSYNDGDIFKVTLERFDTIQIRHTTDLSGSFIISTKPIAVFSGNRCQHLKFGCSHMVTQLPPTTEIDTKYIVPSFFNDIGTLIQVLCENHSIINSSVGSSVLNFHLNKMGYRNIEVTSNLTTVIESDQPVLVTAFGMGNPLHLYHPYMTVIPGIHQYLDYYKIIVPGGYEENFICVIVPSQSMNNLQINGFSASHYTSVYQSELTLTKHYIIRTFKVQSGTFVLSKTDASQFGLIVYGHRIDDGYGFAGNFVH